MLKRLTARCLVALTAMGLTSFTPPHRHHIDALQTLEVQTRGGDCSPENRAAARPHLNHLANLGRESASIRAAAVDLVFSYLKTFNERCIRP